MIYIVYGDEPYLINKKINEIIAKNIDSFICKFDGLDKNYSNLDVVESLTSVDLFSKKNLILVKDPLFLIKKIDDKTIDPLLNYCNKPIYDNDLVFYTLDNSFNKKLKSFKEACLNAEVIELNKLEKYAFYNYAKKVLKEFNLNIQNDAEDYLINNSNFDLSVLNNNLKVLTIYPDIISYEVVTKLITVPDEDDVFNLINALTNKKLSLAIKCANDLLVNDDSVFKLIASIGTQLRFLYAVSYFYSIGKTTFDIMNITNSKEYRIKKANESLKLLKQEDILKLLSRLSDFDYKCKSSNAVPNKLELELLILSLIA